MVNGEADWTYEIHSLNRAPPQRFQPREKHSSCSDPPPFNDLSSLQKPAKKWSHRGVRNARVVVFHLWTPLKVARMRALSATEPLVGSTAPDGTQSAALREEIALYRQPRNVVGNRGLVKSVRVLRSCVMGRCRVNDALPEVWIAPSHAFAWIRPICESRNKVPTVSISARAYLPCGSYLIVQTQGRIL